MSESGLTQAQILRMIAGTSFRQMGPSDYEGFAGAGENALIGEWNDVLIIIDDDGWSVMMGDESETHGNLVVEE